MSELVTVKPKVKLKGFSSENLIIQSATKDDQQIIHRINRLIGTPLFLDISSSQKKLINKIISGYNNLLSGELIEKDEYILSGHELVEFENIHDWEVFRYLVYRYKYNMYPNLKIFDEYPPSIQLEITSVCNFRCVFCYQADKSFSNRDSGFMGNMEFNLFKKVIDELEGNVESITIASRGEPTLHKNFEEMIKYTNGKFLATKINTNASLLNEKKIHTILSNDIQTIVFSIDAADKELYEKLRVNGKFDKTLRNIENFVNIKEKQYPNSRLITRISGVKVNEMQNIEEMEKIWSPFADIVAFTNYTPWESTYENPINDLKDPCTELWRRLFVWWDGKVNPCDYDYKSSLSQWNASKDSVSDIWNSEFYNQMRDNHLSQGRSKYEPCVRCISV